MVPVEILGVHVDPASGMSVVLLGEVGDATRVLPIFIGPAEARAIMTSLAGLTPPRPGTHDLLTEVMADVDARLVEVAVTELAEGTFLATLEVEKPDGTSRISARPSDGLALAVRVGASIVVARGVLDEAAVEIEHDAAEPFDEDEVEQIVSEFQEFLSTAQPSDFRPEPDAEQGEEPEEG